MGKLMTPNTELMGLGRHPHPETPHAAAKFPITSHPSYRSVDLEATLTPTYKYWWQDGVWLNQLRTGTCVGNALSHVLADAPLPVLGVDETYAKELYLDGSGDSTYQKGTSALLVCRAMLLEGSISAFNWCTTPTELRTAILTLGPVCVGMNWYNSMDHPVLRYGKYYLPIDFASGVRGGHEVDINGINLDPISGLPFYRMKQSWGLPYPSPDGNGTARILCTDLETNLFQHSGDAVRITETGKLGT